MKTILSRIAQSVGDRINKVILSEEISEKLTKIPNKINELGYDNWGMSPQYLKRTLSLFRWMCDSYFRIEPKNIGRVPEGRVLFVPNHSGQLPLDGMFMIYTMVKYGTPPRILRAMVERLMPRLPFISTWMIRCGEVVGDPINCKRLLENNEAVLVFPEGVRGSGKSFWERYHLQKFGNGFMRLALETHTPIIPVAIIGAEETYPAIYNAKTLAKLLKFPYFPITPFWPLLGAVGAMPLPAKITIYFGEPLVFEGDFDGPEQEIKNRVKVVMDSIQTMINQGLKERGRKYF